MFQSLLTIHENVPLAPMTTLGVGGPARFFARPEHQDAVIDGVGWARERGLPILILGGGSNLLVADSGFPGLVLRVLIRGIESQISDDLAELTAGAGEFWSGLVAHAVKHDWAGMECLAGIPGLVGATPVQNVGAYGQEVSDTISSVEALDLHSGEILRISNDACQFGYRESRFKTVDQGRYIILRVSYRLRVNGAPTVRYSELAGFLREQGHARPRLADVRTAILIIRRRKSMLLHPQDPNTRSVGSFFINPVLTREDFAALSDTAQTVLGVEAPIPHHLLPQGDVKISAAWLIEHAGFTRGHIRGNVGLSTNHSLALINRGKARATEVIALAREIRNTVLDRFGILLAPEPALVGVSMDDMPEEQVVRFA